MSTKKGAALPTDSDARNELVVYATEDGRAQFYLRAEGGKVWLTQLELAELFQSSVPNININIHIRNLLADGELAGDATIKENLIVRTEGKRTVQRTVKLYNLDLILAVGYWVRSLCSVQFRQWASTHLATCNCRLQVQTEIRRASSPRRGYRSHWQRKHFNLPSPTVVAFFATTVPVATVAKTATVGRSDSVVKKSFTTDIGLNRQGLLDSSIRGAK